MKWEGQRTSSNVEDRRSMGRGARVGGGIGIGSVVIALAAWGLFGINPMTTLGVINNVSGGGSAQIAQGPAQQPPADDRAAQFVSTVLASTEDAWNQVFTAGGARYQPPKLVLYRGITPTACGTGQSAMGPFYCPGDQKIYLDMDFFDTMSRQMGAPGEFARAYVIAHEVGHHVQTLLGITQKVDALRGRISKTQENANSVRVELQADCFAGVWANRSQQAKSWLERGDIESALNAAEKIGDDHLQRQQTGVVRPETFTHGSSAQRQRWFNQGLQTGNINACDTLSAQTL